MSRSLLVVVLAGRRAALPATLVNSVIEPSAITPVPHTAAHIAGLSALRSRPLTMIDGRAALGAEGASDRAPRAVVVEHEGHLYGLLVDSADSIVTMLDEPEPLGADPGHGWRRVTAGRVETEVGALPLLDLTALIEGPDESLAA